VYLLYLTCICCTLRVLVLITFIRFFLCVFVVSYVYLLYYVCIFAPTLDAGLLTKSQYPEGPATGHFDTGFLDFTMSTSEC
jgi:hypothetical protein